MKGKSGPFKLVIYPYDIIKKGLEYFPECHELLLMSTELEGAKALDQLSLTLRRLVRKERPFQKSCCFPET